MCRSGLLEPIGAGQYLVVGPETALGVIAHARLQRLGEYQLAYLSALIDHGLVDREHDRVYAAVRGEQRSRRQLSIAGRPVHLTRIISERKWFGEEWIHLPGQGAYCRSNLERTLLDCLDRPRLCGDPQVIAQAWWRALNSGELNRRRLIDYAIRLGYSVTRRAGYWLERLGEPSTAKPLRHHLGISGPVLLDSSRFFGGRDWPLDRDWIVIVNLPQAGLDYWLGR